MLKSSIINQLYKELSSINQDSNSSKKVNALATLIVKSMNYLKNNIDYTLRTTQPNGLGNINQGDLVEYLVIEFLGLNSTKKTPSSKGVDILDKRFTFNEIKSCINPSNVGFIRDFNKNYIVATPTVLYYCKGCDLLKNINLTSLTKNGYRVKKAWVDISATKSRQW